MKTHPEKSAEILSPVPNLKDVILAVKHHHERFDGLGYPDHLSEETIPLGARIIAVVNAYDKIALMRVNGKSHIESYLRERKTTTDDLQEGELYRQAALFHLKEKAFTHFDPDVVKLFLEFLKKRGIRFKKERHVPLEGITQGMVLSRSIYTKGGKFLLPHGTVLTIDYVRKLRAIHFHDPILEGVYVKVA